MTTLSAELDRALAGNGLPTSRLQWKQLAEGLLTAQPCVFTRNLEISSLYAQLYQRHPRYFKWAGMAAFASYHARIALWPLRLTSDGGFVELDELHQKNRFKLKDIDIVRQTNNAIFEDIFWAHLAYDCSAEGLDRLRLALSGSASDRTILEGFEGLEQARLADVAGREDEATEQIWSGNTLLLEHEQRDVVQGNFDRMTCTFARLFSVGSALDFEAKNPSETLRYFTSFYVYMWTRGLGGILRSRRWPLVTNFSDRWTWIVHSILPRFRGFESSAERIQSRLDMIQATAVGAAACAIPRTTREA